jgi:hypothetical protein
MLEKFYLANDVGGEDFEDLYIFEEDVARWDDPDEDYVPWEEFDEFDPVPDPELANFDSEDRPIDTGWMNRARRELNASRRLIAKGGADKAEGFANMREALKRAYTVLDEIDCRWKGGWDVNPF